MADIPGADKAAEGAHKAGGLLTKNVGPLPMGAWVILVGGGLFFAYRVNSGKGNSKSDVTIKTEPNSDLVGSGPGAVGWNVITQAPTPPAATPATKVTTNAEWYQAAYSYALTQNFAPSVVDSALRKYLAAQPLLPSEQAVIDAIIKGIGAPPELLPPSGQDPVTKNPAPDPLPKPDPIKNPPPPPPPPAPTQQQKFHVVGKWPAKDSTLWGIAQIEYGNGTMWPKIWNANRNIVSNPNLVHPGQKLLIP